MCKLLPGFWTSCPYCRLWSFHRQGRVVAFPDHSDPAICDRDDCGRIYWWHLYPVPWKFRRFCNVCRQPAIEDWKTKKPHRALLEGAQLDRSFDKSKGIWHPIKEREPKLRLLNRPPRISELHAPNEPAPGWHTTGNWIGMGDDDEDGTSTIGTSHETVRQFFPAHSYALDEDESPWTDDLDFYDARPEQSGTQPEDSEGDSEPPSPA